MLVLEQLLRIIKARGQRLYAVDKMKNKLIFFICCYEILRMLGQYPDLFKVGQVSSIFLHELKKKFYLPTVSLIQFDRSFLSLFSPW